MAFGLKARKASEDGGFAKPVLTLATGSVIAQLITIVVLPITTRLFTPAELGVYTLVTSATSMFGMALSLRYDLAIVYESEERNVLPLVALSTVICGVASLAVAVGCFFYFKYCSTSRFSPLEGSLFTFLQCFLFGLINLLTSYNNRCREYKTISSANVERTTAQNAGIVGTGLLGWGATGLVLAQTLGYAVGLRKQSRNLLTHLDELRAVKRGDLGRVARRHRGQALWSTPAALANGFSYSSINYFIELLYSSTVLGYYSFSFRMLGLPITVVGSNISRVYAEKAAAEKKDAGTFEGTFKKILLSMGAGSIVISVLLILVSPQLFAFVFGEDWRVAGVYVQILTPMFALRFVAASLGPSTMISGKQSWDLVTQILLIAAVLLSFGLSLGLSLGVEEMLMLINISCCVVYAVNIFLYWKCSRSR